jgi:hypothetical protein
VSAPFLPPSQHHGAEQKQQCNTAKVLLKLQKLRSNKMKILISLKIFLRSLNKTKAIVAIVASQSNANPKNANPNARLILMKKSKFVSSKRIHVQNMIILMKMIIVIANLNVVSFLYLFIFRISILFLL